MKELYPRNMTTKYVIHVFQEIVLKQKTPIRVLHRRPLATRERSVYSMSTERVDDLNFKLFLCTQAGTYPFKSTM